MLAKRKLVVCFTLCLIIVVTDTIPHLRSYKATTIKHLEDDFADSESFKHITSLSFVACGERYTVQLQVYYPLYYETKVKIVSSGKKEDSHQADINDYVLYHGKVKDFNNSFVLGYFLASGGFQGYIVTDKICCIDSLHDKNGITITHQFKDVVPPGCQIVNDGKDINCLQTGKFEPRFSGLLYEIGGNEMTWNVSKLTEDPFPATEDLSQAEAETIESKITLQPSSSSNVWNETNSGSNNVFSKKRDLLQLKNFSLEQGEYALLHEQTLNSGSVDSDRPNAYLGIGNSSSQSSRSEDVSCGLKIVASRTLMEYFEKRTSDVVKDIFLQTEILNIIYRKISFRNKTKTFKMNFHIDTIILPSKELVEETKHMSVQEFIEKYAYFHSSLQPACLIVGLDMTLENKKRFFVSSTDNGEPCNMSRNTIIVSHGTLQSPEPMALYLAQYVTAITRAMGASDNDRVCQTGFPPNPMVMMENYFLSTHIEPTFSYGVFSACNIREMEKSLANKTCFKPFKFSTCGNGIREADEECDCGPREFCEEIDKCCEPSSPMFQNKTQKHSNGTQCMLRPNAECSAKDACCNKDCSFSIHGTKCISKAHHCDDEICLGNSSDCTCPSSSSQWHSPCKGLECGSIPCATDGLKPCLCHGKDECLICCLSRGVCKTATRELKVMGDFLLKFPDGTECSEDGRCYNGTCIRRKKNPFSKPRTGRAEGNPEPNESSSSSKIFFHYEILSKFLLIAIFIHLSLCGNYHSY